MKEIFYLILVIAIISFSWAYGKDTREYIKNWFIIHNYQMEQTIKSFNIEIDGGK